MNIVRRKCFISYHHADQAAVNLFVRSFDHVNDCFIARGLGQEMSDEIVQSTKTDYVMRRIREKYLADSTVTIVLAGKCTWARRYVDWEIQASLRVTETSMANGLLGIKLPGFSRFPERFLSNLMPPGVNDNTNFAYWIDYPRSTLELVEAIEYCYARRVSHSKYIKNPAEKMLHNRQCN